MMELQPSVARAPHPRAALGWRLTLGAALLAKAVVIVMLLAGCGQKGGLSLPAPPVAASGASAAAR